VEKPSPGFPLFHAAHATTTTRCVSSNPKPKKGSRPLRGLPIPIFHDHLVLETNPRFMIILGLENADGVAALLGVSSYFPKTPSAKQSLLLVEGVNRCLGSERKGGRKRGASGRALRKML
jgi:hypothetical protein